MSRTKVALVVLPAALLVALAVGLTRSTNEDTDDPPPVQGAARGEPFLQPVNETIEVPAGGDCRAVAADAACQGYAVRGTEVAWLVESDAGAPVASFLRRESPTSYLRVLRADGASAAFDRVNVRLADLTGDGGVEAIFGYHRDVRLSVDIVDPTGMVIGHLDLNDGEVLVDDGRLVTFERLPDGWLREEVVFTSGAAEVVTSEQIPGPAEGNI